MEARCFDCRFFCREGIDKADELTAEDWDECLEGDCRRSPPVVGRFRGEDEYLRYDYGQWPLVQAVNWCGAFEPCQRAIRDSAATSRQVCAGRDISCGAGQGCGCAADRRHVATPAADSKASSVNGSFRGAYEC